jgi:hypothetical protein
MNQKTKKIIAKEIIIFFSSVIIIGLFWLSFTYTNDYRIQRVNKLEKLISSLQTEVDSLQYTFDKLIYYRFTATGYAAQLAFEADKAYHDRLDKENTPPNNNIKMLYCYLTEYQKNYISQDSFFLSKDCFIKNTLDILNNPNPPKENKLYKLYKHLKRNDAIRVSYEKFISIMSGESLTSEESKRTYKLRKKILKLTSDKESNSSEILDEIELEKRIVKYILIVLALIYPLRYILLSIIWAVKTLKNK